GDRRAARDLAGNGPPAPRRGLTEARRPDARRRDRPAPRRRRLIPAEGRGRSTRSPSDHRGSQAHDFGMATIEHEETEPDRVAALVALWFAGLGVIAWLAPRIDPGAKAALAAPVAAAVLVCASPLVYVHATPGLLAAVVLGCLSLLSAVRLRAVRAIIRSAAAPAAIATLALVLNAAPALRQGNWVATSFGNADPYLWVSQARSLSSGPPAAPAATFPDRVTYG